MTNKLYTLQESDLDYIVVEEDQRTWLNEEVKKYTFEDEDPVKQSVDALKNKEAELQVRLGKDLVYFDELNTIAENAETEAAAAKKELGVRTEKLKTNALAKEEVEMSKDKATQALINPSDQLKNVKVTI